MQDVNRVVVVGGSLAGLRACEALRAAGHDGAITLIGDEPHPPYDRPPLSKKLLAGDWEAERIGLRAPDKLAELGLDLRLGVRADGLDVGGRTVTVADGDAVTGDAVVIATGARPRRLPSQGDGVHVLRTLDDALALRAALTEGAHLVVIGAGFIGLEVAATALARGARVTVLEGLPAPLIRGLGPDLGAAVTRPLIESGVDLRCRARVETVEAEGVALAGGERLSADAVLVGIGVEPATDWLAGSGLTIADGVVADETLCAAPGIYVAGDVARWKQVGTDEDRRLEHWTNAADQGAATARNLLAEAAGEPGTAFAPVPFVWSDQGRHRVQILGWPAGDDDETVVAVGDTGGHAFVALVRRGDRLRGVIGFNAPKPTMAYQPLLAAGATWDEAMALAADQTVPAPRPRA